MKNFLLDLLFPKFCLSCQKEGSYLCQDCQSCLEISGFHQKHSTREGEENRFSSFPFAVAREGEENRFSSFPFAVAREGEENRFSSFPFAVAREGEENRFSSSPFAVARELDDLYFAVPYQNFLIKNLIQKFKYEPFVKELAKPLAFLIITHFQLLEKFPDFSEFILIPIPLSKRRLKWRGFNQAQELGKELAEFLNLPLSTNCLIKTKETIPQIELDDKTRRESVKEAFLVKNTDSIKEKEILLIDDVYTTGSTMTECARVLKTAGAKKIIGVTIARG